MNRINRVTSILIQLQSKKIIPAKEIAQRFNISLRTVYRDIRTLEEAGIPIGSEAGKGYFLVEGFLLPPVMFTAAEVGALITAGKFLNCHGDESFIKDFDSAMYKIKFYFEAMVKKTMHRSWRTVLTCTAHLDRKIHWRITLLQQFRLQSAIKG